MIMIKEEKDVTPYPRQAGLPYLFDYKANSAVSRDPKLCTCRFGMTRAKNKSKTPKTLAQRLPEDLEQQTVKCYRFVITSRQRHGYFQTRIFNMDETPMWFELPSSRTLEFEFKVNNQ